MQRYGETSSMTNGKPEVLGDSLSVVAVGANDDLYPLGSQRT